MNPQISPGPLLRLSRESHG
uniref:Truncated APOBEC3G n=1 Tax=Macaca leonina TaxID=90387 RepID=A0A2U7NT55_MACLI|nr:truncated APOBEC3G [Macaca leonina]